MYGHIYMYMYVNALCTHTHIYPLALHLIKNFNFQHFKVNRNS